MYTPWVNTIDKNVELICLQLPGRGGYIFDTPYSNMNELLNDALEDLIPFIDRPYIFLGYSLGAKIAFELMLRLKEIGFPLPVHFVAIASPAPHLPRRTPHIHHLPDDELVKSLAAYQGTPKELLYDKDLMELLLPAIRADFTLLEKYRCTSQDVVPTTLSVFGGQLDKDVEEEELSAWKKLFAHTYSFELFPGGHFFIKESESLLLKAVNALCAQETIT